MELSRHLGRKIFRILHTNTYTYNWARRASNTSHQTLSRGRRTQPLHRALFLWLNTPRYSSLDIRRDRIVLGEKKFKIEISSFVKNNISDTNEREPLNHHLATRTTVCFVVVLFLRLNNPLVIRLISGEISRKEFKIGQLSLSDYWDLSRLRERCAAAIKDRIRCNSSTNAANSMNTRANLSYTMPQTRTSGIKSTRWWASWDRSRAGRALWWTTRSGRAFERWTSCPGTFLFLFITLFVLTFFWTRFCGWSWWFYADYS